MFITHSTSEKLRETKLSRGLRPQLLLYTRTIEKLPKLNSYYFSPFANTDVECFFVCSLVPAGACVLLANLSASLASRISSSLRKLGWFVEDSSLAHILSVILTLFRVDVTLCCPNKLQVSLMVRKIFGVHQRRRIF